MHRFLILIVLLAAPALGAPTAPTEVPAEMVRLLKELDSNRFEVRHRAAERIEAMVARPELAAVLAGEFQRVLRQPELSFEVRWHVKNWARRLPSVVAAPPADASAEELDRLVQQLDADSYSARSGAALRFEWLLSNHKLVTPLLMRVKTRLNESGVVSDSRQPLVIAWQRARAAWLLGGARTDDLPPVTEEQMAGWLNDLARPTDGNGRYPREAAERELLDLLARDAFVPKLKKAIEERLAKAGDNSDYATRLATLLEWTKPELVAEYWEDGHQENEQHLLVGVPTLSPGAARPSHFDRVDDRTAHCVSGNSLSPGDYPVGIAFPHPKREGAAFHLVNLPTPQRRMAYTCFVKTDESKRLTELTKRTLDRIVAERRPLTESELLMLVTLDAAEVSRFAAKHFATAEDRALAENGPPRLGGRPSHFGLLCVLLAKQGTKEAMPGLADAIEKKVFLPPSARAQYRLHWLAALAIALRDPWPDADQWLIKNLEQSEPLVEGQPDPAEVGASAAAALLIRHQQMPSDFGLAAAADPLLNHLKVPGFRYRDASTPKQIRKWWNERQAKEKTP